jgi:DNA-binding winged helix-turn-helix (wHTH) protein
VSRETLFHEVWGEIFVTDGSLTRCIAELRRIFDDDVREPRVIQTIAKQGYRLIAPVTAAPVAPFEVAPAAAAPGWLPAAAAGLVVGMFAGCAAMWLRRRG